jgi:tetratricopeptide (TPR) repeat protein
VISHLTILVFLLLSLGAGPAVAGEKSPTLRQLKQAVASNPQDPQAHYALGVKYEGLGETKKAMGEYKKTLILKPNDEQALYRWGRLTGELGDSDQAIRILKQAVKLNPNFTEARSLLAAEYNRQATGFMAQGRLESAQEALEAGIQANGGPTETAALRNNLGCLYVRQNRLDQATDAFREVLKQNPNVPQAHYNLGLIYYTQGNYQAASVEFYALKGLDRDMAGELSSYRFKVEAPYNVTPPVKTMITFKGSPLLTEGTVLPSYAK